MLDVLKFVQGAVSKKDFVPELTHFKIKDGRITGYNGKISISSPINLDIDCCPKADAFVRAVQACTETAQLHLTTTGKLSIRSGRFRTHVETVADAFTGIDPEGTPVELGGNLLPAFAKLYDFTAEDASRPWAAGIVLDGASAFATNNVILAEHWLGYHFPFRVNIPRYAVKEILRIGEEPLGMFVTANNATFFFSGHRWLRTQLCSTDWPDTGALFARMGSAEPVPEGFFEALATIEPFVDEGKRVHFRGECISTLPTDDGTNVELMDLPVKGIYNVKMLRALEGVATQIGFNSYPAPCPFYGDKIRGFIVGMRS